MRRRTLKRAGAVVAAGLLVLGAAAFALSGQGGLERYPAPEQITPQTLAATPQWTRPCWGTRVRSAPGRTRWCARLRARVLFVKREDGRGDGDAHLVTMADRRIVYAKVSLADQARLRVPGIGDAVTIVGPVVAGAHVSEQVWAQELSPGLG